MLIPHPNPCSINDCDFFCAGNGAIQLPGTPQSPCLQKVPCNEVVRTADLTSAPQRQWHFWFGSHINDWLCWFFCSSLDFHQHNFQSTSFFALCRVAYGSKAHFLNILLYLLGLMPLTYLIVSMRPSIGTNGTGHHNITMVKVSFQEVLKKLFDGV